MQRILLSALHTSSSAYCFIISNIEQKFKSWQSVQRSIDWHCFMSVWHLLSPPSDGWQCSRLLSWGTQTYRWGVGGTLQSTARHQQSFINFTFCQAHVKGWYINIKDFNVNKSINLTYNEQYPSMIIVIERSHKLSLTCFSINLVVIRQ